MSNLIVKPSFLLNVTEETTHCTRCCRILNRETLTTRRLVDGDCYDCRQGMRPFMTSTGDCTCEYEKYEAIRLTCNNCSKCSDCGLELYTPGTKIRDPLCSRCETRNMKQEEFFPKLKFHFGKYKDKTVKAVAEEDKRYIEWLSKSFEAKTQYQNNFLKCLKHYAAIQSSGSKISSTSSRVSPDTSISLSTPISFD